MELSKPRNDRLTLGAVLDQTRGIGQGFDFLRIALSFCIVCWHSVDVCYGDRAGAAMWLTPLGPLGAILLPAFFALSGFLVMGSAVRVKSLTTFLSFRILRILPALSTEVFFGAVLLGAAVTALPLQHYFTSHGFVRYFFNITGHVVFTLPGVFQQNPTDVVNMSLWTIPPEIACYVFMALMLISNAVAKRIVYCIVTLILIVINLLSYRHLTAGQANGHVQPYDLFMCFVVGNILFLYRHKIPASRWLFAICAGLALVLIRIPLVMNFGLIAACYCVVYLGTVKLPKLGLLSTGDYSYGVYLYGFPMQQLVAMAFPSWRFWWFNIAVSMPFILAFAMFSWHFIEKPTLRLKERVKFLRESEAKWLARYPIRLRQPPFYFATG